jgi:hypothetical protein
VVSLIGENWTRRRRNLYGRKVKGRARPSSPRLPRYRLEVLEARLLLFGGQVQPAVDLIALSPEAAPAAVVQLAPGWQQQQGRGLLPDGGVSPGVADQAPTLPIGVLQTAQVRALVVESPIVADVATTSVPVAGGILATGGAPVDGPLIVALPNAVLPEAGGGLYQSAGGVQTASFVSVGSTVGVNGIGSLSVTVGLSSGQSYPVDRGWMAEPTQRMSEYTGTIGPGQTAANVFIPLDSGIETFKFVVRPDGNPDSSRETYIDQVTLDDATGKPLAEVGQPPNPGMPPPEMDVAVHGAPTEGHLVVQVTSAGTLEAASGAQALSSAAPDTSVSFVLYVQRQSPEAAAESALPAQAQTALGVITLASSTSSGDSPFAVTTSIGLFADGVPAGPDAALTSSHDTAALVASDVADGFNLRVLTGPLASRSAGPLGPIVAVADLDPTPPVNRHERALLQDIEGLEEDDGPGATVARDVLAEATSSPDNADGWIAPSGSGEDGELPNESGGLMRQIGESAHQLGRRAGLSGLLADLAAGTAADRATPGSPENGSSPAENGTLIAGEAISRGERKAAPDYVKVVYGLAFGLGLTAGPLFPNLMTSGRFRVPKWLRNRRAHMPLRRTVASSSRRFRSIAGWLSGRLSVTIDRNS